LWSPAVAPAVACGFQANPWAVRSAKVGVCFAAVSFFIFNDFSRPNCLNVYQTDLRQICTVGNVDLCLWMNDLKLVCFRSGKGRCHGNKFSAPTLGPVHTSVVRVTLREEVQLLHRAQANKLPDSMDAGEPIN